MRELYLMVAAHRAGFHPDIHPSRKKNGRLFPRDSWFYLRTGSMVSLMVYPVLFRKAIGAGILSSRHFRSENDPESADREGEGDES